MPHTFFSSAHPQLPSTYCSPWQLSCPMKEFHPLTIKALLHEAVLLAQGISSIQTEIGTAKLKDDLSDILSLHCVLYLDCRVHFPYDYFELATAPITSITQTHDRKMQDVRGRNRRATDRWDNLETTSITHLDPKTHLVAMFLC